MKTTTKCDDFLETNGMACFDCELADCILEGSSDPVKHKALGYNHDKEMFFDRWDQELAW